MASAGGVAGKSGKGRRGQYRKERTGPGVHPGGSIRKKHQREKTKREKNPTSLSFLLVAPEILHETEN